MYCGINCQSFQNIPSINALLSAAEMLQTSHPTISGSLKHYATSLLSNKILPTDPNYQSLLQLSNQTPSASAIELEQFADALIASAQGPYETDFYRLAYLIYGSISVQCQLPTRIMNKIHNAQQFTACNSPSFAGYGSGSPNTYAPLPPNDLVNSQILPPPDFFGTSTQNIPSTFNQSGPPTFTPQFASDHPPEFTPPTQPTYNPTNNFNPSYPSAPSPSHTVNSIITQNSLKMAEMAQVALTSGNQNLAFSLLLGAILELQKPS